jgi:hypothetical protein
MFELGQSDSQIRTVTISREEAQMLARIVESVAKFAKDFPLEFYSYCPPDRWKPVLEQAGQGIHDVQSQLSAGHDPIIVSAGVLTSVMDIEECVSGSRDQRLDSAKWALGISAAGAIAQTVFGISWLALPAYITSLAIVLGRPLWEMVKPNPAGPFKPDVFPEVDR